MGVGVEFVADKVPVYVLDTPNTWSDGSKVQDPVSGIEVAGAKIFSKSMETFLGNLVLGASG